MKLSKTTVPVVMRGRDVPAGIRIAENGQIRFNHKASKSLLEQHKGDKFPGLFVALNDETRILSFFVKAGKFAGEIYTEEDRFSVHLNPKDNSITLGASGLLKQIGYDYEASGAQIFMTHSNKDGSISTSKPLPQGALEKREVKPRKPRAKKEGAAQGEPEVVVEAELVEA